MNKEEAFVLGARIERDTPGAEVVGFQYETGTGYTVFVRLGEDVQPFPSVSRYEDLIESSRAWHEWNRLKQLKELT